MILSRFHPTFRLVMLMGGLGLAASAANAPMDPKVPPVPPPSTTVPPPATVPPVTPASQAAREALGRNLFRDPSLSVPVGTSCASCHTPLKGFEGNNGGTFGVPLGSTKTPGLRNTPSAMYALFTPPFAVSPGPNGQPVARGGQFHDGRADSLAQQALGPFLASAEMNNPNGAAVVAKVAKSSYAAAFKAQWGADIFTKPDAAFAAIGESIAAYERTIEFRPFTSRFDDLVRGKDTFTAAEKRGMSAFFDRTKGDCASCHAASPTNASPTANLFTNHSYVALGIPRNTKIPANANPLFFDLGLAGPNRTAPAGVANAAGQFKVPTLRNVALKTAFMHNGRFTSLIEVVGFYATRDLEPKRWYPDGIQFNDLPASLRGNVTHRPPLDLRPGAKPRLTSSDVLDIVAFLGTLTDVPPPATFATAQ